MGLIRFKCVFQMRQVGENLDHGYVSWLDDKIYEANLTLRYICCRAVVELTDGEFMLLFQVALLEELHKDEVCPELAQIPRLRRIRDVR